MEDQIFAAGQGERLTIPGIPCTFSTFNSRSLRNFFRSLFSAVFLRTGFDILGLTEVQAGFKDLHSIPALRAYMTQYAFSFWCCSTIGPEGQNCFGQAGVALMCRRRPSHAFFGFDKALKPALDTDTQGRLITLVFLDYVIFHLYVPAKPAQMLEFYKKLTTHVKNTMETFKLPCIMMGDLNCPFTEEDISDSRPWIQPITNPVDKYSES